MDIIGYTLKEHDDNYYIVTIKVLDKEPISVAVEDIEEENKLYAKYKTTKYEIIQIEDIDEKICDIKIDLPEVIEYYLPKEIPINKINNKIFFEDKNKLKKEFSGIQRLWYDNGQLEIEFFHINGKINGEYKSYYKKGQLEVICNYIDDKKFGEYKSYWSNGELEEICNYIDGKKFGEYKSYHANGWS